MKQLANLFQGEQTAEPGLGEQAASQPDVEEEGQSGVLDDAGPLGVVLVVRVLGGGGGQGGHVLDLVGDGGLDVGQEGRVGGAWGRVDSREQALGVRDVALQRLHHLVQLIFGLRLLVDLGLEVLKDLGVYHA